jgi:hypothetical protein
MVRVNTSGLMAVNIKVNITWIRSMATVSLTGQMVASTKASGPTVSSTAKENFRFLLMARAE